MEAASRRPAQATARPGTRCWNLASTSTGTLVATARDGYRVKAHSQAGAADFYLKPTRLGAYLIYDQGVRLIAGRRGVERAEHPGKAAQWTPKRAPHRTFEVASTANGRRLAASQSGHLILASAGKSSHPTRFKFKDAGGSVIFGRTFAPFGVTRALGNGGDAREHGPDGSLDVTGNLLRSGTPFGTHDTHGWPTFAGWPVHDTITHQQTYYAWLKRMWKAGERLVVAQTVEDEPLCRLEPRRSHPCDETESIKLEIQRLKKLEHYTDAQSGGPRRGWFQVVRNPGDARRVIEHGKLAVLIGIESSNPLGCREFMDEPQCTRADIDRGLRDYRRLGVRSMFVAHWVDNAFAGAALEGGARGSFIGIMQALQTGEYFDTSDCPERGQGEELDPLGHGVLKLLSNFFPNAKKILGIPIPDYPAGNQCNAKGLTELGRYVIRRMIANHMLIEVDHMSERARLTFLKMAEARDYPLVSSHTDTGGTWTPSDLRRLYALGGFATATPDESPELADKILRFRPFQSADHYFGVGLGTDTGGFSELPGPRPDAGQDPLPYPFRSFKGDVEFARERTGKRTFDLNTDGVAHYGLLADLLADMQRQRRGRKAMPILFRSAETYLQTWRAAMRHG